MTEREFSERVHSRIYQLFLGVRLFIGDNLVSIYSGFAVEINGRWMWVTASHVFDHIDSRINSVQGPEFDFNLFKMEWLVPRHSLEKGAYFTYKPGIALRFDELAKARLAARAYSGNPENELLKAVADHADVGVLLLSEYDMRVLSGLGVEPLRKPDVVSVSPEFFRTTDPRAWQLLIAGIPSETIRLDEDSGEGTLSIMTLPLGFIRKQKPTFPNAKLRPRWPASLHAGDIMGMSGGPILAIGPNGEVRLGGIQSKRKGSSQSRPKYLKVIVPEAFFDILASRLPKAEDHLP